MLETLTTELAREKFTDIVSKETLENYIKKNFNPETLVADSNSMSNQWLVVYVDDQPAGYARLTTIGKRPESIANRGIVRIADFGILKKYSDSGAHESLLEKCLTVCKRYEAIWINEFKENKTIDFFKNNGFILQDEENEYDELYLASVCLIRERS